jgi:hypothetical protein
MQNEVKKLRQLRRVLFAVWFLTAIGMCGFRIMGVL